MPLYLVCHPQEKLSLVFASNLMELYKVTDCGQYVSRRPCTFKEIKKPLCLNITTSVPIFNDRYDSIDLIPNVDCQKECIESYSDLLLSGLYSDVTLEVDSTEFKCHKAILANRCQFFKVMFESDMLESKSKTINLRGHDTRTITCVIKFIYTGEFTVANLNSEGKEIKQGEEESLDAHEMAKFFDNILKAADYFGLEMLDKVCQRKIAEYCQNSDIYLPEDFLGLMFSIAVDYNYSDLKYFIAGRLCTYLQEEIKSETAYDIVNNLQIKELYLLVVRILRERGNDIMQQHYEDIVGNAITESANINEVILKLNDLIQKKVLSKRSFALHYISKLCSQSDMDSCHTWTHFWRNILETLIENGFDVNEQDKNGDTALHIACRGDANRIMTNTDTTIMLIQWLLKHGVNPHTRNNKGFTALDEAYEHINQSLPLIASYYIHEEDDDRMHIVSQSSLIQDCSDKITCLQKQETLLQNAMAEEGALGFNSLPLLSDASNDDIIENNSSATDLSSITLTEQCDEMEDAVESESSDTDESEVSTPLSFFKFNPDFLKSCRNMKSLSSRNLIGCEFSISDMVGDNEGCKVMEKLEADMLRFMYPEMWRCLVTMDDLDSINSQQIKALEEAALNDVLARKHGQGSGYKLQSTDTLTNHDPDFDEILRSAADSCIMPYSELLANIALVS